MRIWCTKNLILIFLNFSSRKNKKTFVSLDKCIVLKIRSIEDEKKYISPEKLHNLSYVAFLIDVRYDVSMIQRSTADSFYSDRLLISIFIFSAAGYSIIIIQFYTANVRIVLIIRPATCLHNNNIIFRVCGAHGLMKLVAAVATWSVYIFYVTLLFILAHYT